jgi:hypothetical protein
MIKRMKRNLDTRVRVQEERIKKKNKEEKEERKIKLRWYSSTTPFLPPA